MRLMIYDVIMFLLLIACCPATAQDWNLESYEEQLMSLCIQEKYPEALELTEQAVKTLQQSGKQDDYDWAACVGVLGELHYIAGDKKKSKKYTGQAMKLINKLAADDPEDFINGREMMPAFDALDTTLKDLSGMPIIPYCRWKVQHTIKEHGETDPEAAMAMKDLAEAYRTVRQYKRALRYCVLAGRNLKKGGGYECPPMASILYLMSRIYWEMDQPEKREKYLKSSLKMFNKVDVDSDPLFKIDLLNIRMELQKLAGSKGSGEILAGVRDSGTGTGDGATPGRDEDARTYAKHCRANLRLLEGGIDMWEMEGTGERFNNGNDGPLCDADGNPTALIDLLIPDYLKYFPPCKAGGIYTYRANDYAIECSIHGTLKKPKP